MNPFLILLYILCGILRFLHVYFFSNDVGLEKLTMQWSGERGDIRFGKSVSNTIVLVYFNQ
jgi:hypothetical protein